MNTHDPDGPVVDEIEQFRKDICAVFIKAMDRTRFDALAPHEQMDSIMLGGMAGVVGTLMAFLKGHHPSATDEEITEVVQSCVPYVMQHARAVFDNIATEH